jgi:hypothetical protein
VNYRCCVKWKEEKVAFTERAPEHSRKSIATSNHAVLKAKRARPSAEQRTWSRGTATLSEEASCHSQHSIPTTTLTPQQVTEAPKQLKVTATRKVAKPKKPVPKPTAATKAATVKPPHSRTSLPSSTTYPSRHV